VAVPHRDDVGVERARVDADRMLLGKERPVRTDPSEPGDAADASRVCRAGNRSGSPDGDPP
jgi:hypothetical protein